MCEAFSSRELANEYIAAQHPVTGIRITDQIVIPYYTVHELDLDAMVVHN